MPKLTVKIPAYRRHSGRIVAFVVINGKRIYLPGKYGSSQSRDEYKRLVREWDLNGRSTPPVPDTNDLTITELVAAYWGFAERHYVKNGRQTDEVACLRAALRPLAPLRRLSRRLSAPGGGEVEDGKAIGLVLGPDNPLKGLGTEEADGRSTPSWAFTANCALSLQIPANLMTPLIAPRGRQSTTVAPSRTQTERPS